MREEGAQFPAAAVGAALGILSAALQPSPLASGLSPLWGRQSTTPAPQPQSTRRVTEGQGGF